VSNGAEAEALEGIAVVGMACRFPGASDVEQFWQNLANGVESVTFFADQELLLAGVEPALLADPSYVKAGVLLDGIDRFDAAFFGMTRREAEIMDPQQRIFLECAHVALEDAGYDATGYDGLIGVYGGVGGNAYLHQLLGDQQLVNDVGTYSLSLSNEKDFLATRVSYKLRLKGPSMTIQTACSTSLVAVHIACQSLLNYEADMALCGGCSIDIPQVAGYLFRDGGILSPDGHCRAFDAHASGTVAGRGAGVVALKRLADARKDGDQIHAVILSSAINNDGAAKAGFTAPSQDGQAAVIAQAQALARIEPDSIGFVEAHGTGTQLGDPIEFAALTQAFRRATDRKHFAALGSVKTNIGHLDTASGVAGLIKAVLALKHRQIPPSLNFERPNTAIDLANSPFYINTRLVDWPAQPQPRRAGVSSFGIGGTNVHLILEEAPAPTPIEQGRPAQLLLLSARTPTGLNAATANLARYCREHPAVALADVAFTLQQGRRAHAERRMLVCRDLASAAPALELLDPRQVVTASTPTRDRGVVFLFPGQGAQYAGMGRELYRSEPTFREQLDHCAEALVPHLGLDLRDVMFSGEPEDPECVNRLTETRLAQPSLFAFEYALARLWEGWGIQPHAMLGHSIGEYVAACLAGVFSLPDALALVAARGRLMQALTPGAMLAVPLHEEEVAPLLNGHVSLAAVNGPRSCVVSGSSAAIDSVAERLARQGVEVRRLRTSHAFHSAMMDPILGTFADEVRRVPLQAPRLPYISNLTGSWIRADEATDPTYWSRHLRQTVRFDAGLEVLCREPEQLFIEVGPGQVLSNLVRRRLGVPRSQQVVASLGDPRSREGEALLGAVGLVWLGGVEVSWVEFSRHARGRRVSLPTYPFEREHHWIDAPPQAPQAPQRAAAIHQPIDPSRHSPDQVTAPAQNGASMIAPQASPAEYPARYRTILSMLQGLLYRLTGADASEIGVHTSFFDIGLDSLLLIQFVQAIQDSFGMKISLVELLERYTTLDSLATIFDQQLPAEAFAEEAVLPQAVRGPEPSMHAPPPPTSALQRASADATVPSVPVPMLVQPRTADAPPRETEPFMGELERLMSQQLQLISQVIGQQLAAIRPAAPGSTTPPAQVLATQPPLAAVDAQLPAIGVSMQAPDGATQRNATQRVVPAPYVHYRPAEIAASSELTEQQRTYLQEFTERYTRRTHKSKELNQIHRPYHADSRSTAVFRLIWKELVYPIVGHRSAGSRMWDVDGNEYIDITMGFGVHLFGHSPDFITQALEGQLKIGIQLGPQSYLAGEVAKLICELTGAERVAFCNSGTEAVIAAMRIARTVSRRNKIVCFNGSYHGWSDGNLVRQVVKDGAFTTVPLAPGVPPSAVADMLVLDYDDPRSLELIRAHAHDLAAVLVEPVQSRRPDLQPRAFLQSLRKLTEELGIILIFDEMVNGFRIHPGGAQAYFDIRADIVTYGKIVGGGLPIGVIAGKATYLDSVDGGMWRYGDSSYPQAEKTLLAGAFFKHPLTMAAAFATLNHMKVHGPALQEEVNRRTTRLASALNAYFEQERIPIEVVHFSSVFRFYIPREARHLDLFFYHLTLHGLYNWEGGNCFLSTAHTDEDSERIIDAVKASVADLRRGGFLGESPPTPSDRGGTGEPGGAYGAGTTPILAGDVRRAAPAGGTTRQAAGATKRAIQFSLYYFGNYDAPFDPDKYKLLFEGARFGDTHGFAAVWIPERHFHSFGGFSPNPSVLAAALARETTRIHIRAGSVALPLHHPIRVAEEWSVVDNLSGGRVGVSFASGWHPDDFVFAPESYERRREVMLEGVEIIKKLWGGGSVMVRGGAQSQIEVRLHPMPQQAELPSWLTCAHRDSFITAGKLGTGVLTNLLDQPMDDLAEKIAAYRRSLAEHGHEPDRGHVTVLIHTFLGPDAQGAIEEARAPFCKYLRSSMGLLRNMARAQGRDIDLERMPEEDLQYLLSETYDRIVQAGLLIGTPDSCAPVVQQLRACGVDEIGCLIDFVTSTPAALGSLAYLDQLRHRFTEPTVAQAATYNLLVAGDADTVPLTEAQKGLWVLSQLGTEEARLYNESLAMRLEGDFDPAAMREALLEVIRRHQSLRTIFDADGAYQRVLPGITLDIPYIELSGTGVAEREAEASALIARDIREPFDLQRGPLLRVKLVKLQEHEHLFLLTIHHIITDGWSISIIMNEVATLYLAARRGAPADLPAPRQFRDFVRWLEVQEAGSTAEHYWLERFSDVVPVLELPTDAPRPPVRTFRGEQQSDSIDATLFKGLKALAAQQGCTPFMALVAGFNVLMHRISGQDDLIIGVPAAGQLAMGGAYLTGYCLNLLPLRSKLPRRTSFAVYLAGVKRALLEAYDHQNYSFGRLVKKLHLDQDLSRPPLVNVVFNLEAGGIAAAGAGDLAMELVPTFTGVARFDINLNVIESDDTLVLDCDFNADMFAPATIRRWLGCFRELLTGIVAHPERQVAELRLLSGAEYQELIVARNATAADYPRDRCFHQAFEAQVARTPEQIALVCGEQRLTYRELNARANQLAHHLRARGIGPEARVAVCLERTPEMVIGLLGILKAGGAFVPIDPAFPPARIFYIIEDAQAALLLTQTATRSRLPDLALPTCCVDEEWSSIASGPAEQQESGVSAANLAYLIYTSGSTGRPKGVLIPHRGLMNYLAWCVEAYGASRGVGAPVHASIAADAIFPSLFAPLMAGTAVFLFSGERALDELGASLEQVGPYSLVKITPSQLEVLTLQLPAAATHQVRTLVVGAEEVRGEMLTFWRTHAPETALLNEYGPTETVVGCSIYRVPDGHIAPGTVPIGLPIANTTFYVLDGALQPAPIGVPGELYIGGEGVARGYHNRPELTAEKFIPDPFADTPGARLYRTGDMVRLLDDRAGNIVFLGRIDDQVKIRGYRVEPGEVGEALGRHPGVREVVVLAREEQPGDRRLIAYVVPAPASPSVGELRQFLQARLPEYMIPAHFVFLDALPLAPHGKIDRALLPAPSGRGFAAERSSTPPQTPLELQIADVWNQVLRTDGIGVHDNFFEVGGDSLLAIRLISRLRDAFQIEIAPRSVFEHPTIDGLSVVVAQKLGEAVDDLMLEELLDDIKSMP